MLSRATCLGALVISTSTLAADPAKVQEAQIRFKEGVRLMNTGDYEHARLQFANAYTLANNSDALYNLGYTEVKSGHFVEGARHLRQFIHRPKVEQADIDKANKFLSSALEHVGDVTVETKANAVIAVDKENVGQAPLPDPVAVTPGKHKIVVQFGDQQEAKEFQVAAGEKLKVALLLSDPSTSTTAALAPVQGDPAPVKTTGAEGATVDIRSGIDRGTAPNSNRETNPTRYWVAGGFAVGALALATGGVLFGAASTRAKDDAEAARKTLPDDSACLDPAIPGCAALKDSRDSQNRNGTISWVMYAGAGAFAVAAVASWVFISPERAASRSVATPIVGPTTLGAQWMTRF
ncbi:tol-pal system YbgF family protein [Pendulispora albinea]|uniref:PEGA domain-containing protein n=1 Tax=Pendulispora albinea TaxID=2741071 RepID=A0ABZ2LMN6_9BACT